MTGIVTKTQHSEGRPGGRCLRQETTGVVVAPVVNDKDLIVHPAFVHRRTETRNELWKYFFLIEDGHNDGEFGNCLGR
jgi:hypothetical protein